MKSNDNIYNFLKLNGFRLVKEDSSTFFGDYSDVFINNYQLRFSSSNSFETVDIRSNLPNESWYDLALVKALLYDEKKLDDVIPFEVYKEFLQQELTNITELFEDKKYPTTKKKLEELENKRTKQMFPGMRK